MFQPALNSYETIIFDRICFGAFFDLSRHLVPSDFGRFELCRDSRRRADTRFSGGRLDDLFSKGEGRRHGQGMSRFFSGVKIWRKIRVYVSNRAKHDFEDFQWLKTDSNEEFSVTCPESRPVVLPFMKKIQRGMTKKGYRSRK